MLRLFKQSSTRAVVINATNIGKKPSGIAIYTLSLLKELTRLPTAIKFTVYLNKNARGLIKDIHFPENFFICWTSKMMSPDYRFQGHLLRLLYANWIGWKHFRQMLFNTSQLEACLFRPRQIITIHDVIPYLFKQYHKKQYYYFKYFLKWALRSCDQVITPSHHSRKLIRKLYHFPDHHIHVIPNGIQPVFRLRSEPIRKNDPYILFIGRFSPMKNIAGLIRAFELIKDRIPHRLVFIGDDAAELEREVCAGRLQKAQLTNARFSFPGNVPLEKMPGWIRNASLLVFPSLYEGFGLPPLEAMAGGCPVVASHAACIPEVCGEAVYYVDPYQIEDIARGIYQVLTRPALQKQLIDRGYFRTRLFSWKQSARDHLSVLENVMRPAPPKLAVSPPPLFGVVARDETVNP